MMVNSGTDIAFLSFHVILSISLQGSACLNDHRNTWNCLESAPPEYIIAVARSSYMDKGKIVLMKATQNGCLNEHYSSSVLARSE